MTIKEAYNTQYRFCIKNKIPVEMDGHYQTRFKFDGSPVYVNEDGSPVISYKFNISGVSKGIHKDDKEMTIHKDKLPVYGRISCKRVSGFLYKYLLFLRCDGIEDPEVQKLYVLHCLSSKFEYFTRDHSKKGVRWKKYTPVYDNVRKMVGSLIRSVQKKELTEETRNEFRVITTCKLKPMPRRERLKYSKIGQGMATDNKIRSMYDPTLTDEENAKKVGLSTVRIKEWKAGHKELLESKEERIRRMYDPSKGKKENARIIGVSLNTLKKYIVDEVIPVKEVESVKEVELSKAVDQPIEEDLDKWIDEAIEEWDLTH